MVKTPEQRAKDVVYQVKLQHKKRDMVQAYRVEKGCLVCGTKNPHVLDLDHRDPGTKNNKLRHMRYRGSGGRQWRAMSFKEIEEELLKCDVLCSNHHRIRTAWMRQFDDRYGHRNPNVPA